ncbi:MAG: FAD-binding oxidoreductase, partial [Burkholderiales bacterium]
MEPRFPPALHQELKNRFAERYSTAQAVREHHGKDESPYDPMLPDAVVFVRTTQEIIELVHACEHYRVPLIPYGAGSSIEGHLLALQGGISIDMSQMNQVLAVNAEDLTATVQAGVTRKQLTQELKSSGLFFPIDPGADATLGGMTATRASGTNAVRYGTMRENVLGLTVVTAQGKVVQTSRRAKKSSAGYDLTRLFVGSEGTLGIITEVTVKLYPQPEAISGATVHFPTVADAVNTVITTIQLGIPIARAELLDSTTLRAINAYSKTQLPEQPTLFLEFHGSPASVEEQAQTVQEIAQEHQGAEFQWATQPEQRSKLWQARHDAYFAALQLKPGCRSVTTDVCVPISRLAEVIEVTQQILSGSNLPAPLFGHVGDGNFHCAILVNPENAAELAEAERLN